MTDTDRARVEYLTSLIPVSDEDIVDFGIGTAEQQAAAAARIELERKESDRRWRALPWTVRMSRRARFYRWSIEERARSRIHSWLFPDCDGGQ